MHVNRLLAGRMKNLTIRAAVFQTVRDFFIKKGYLEVDTPSRIPAPLPEIHIDAIASDDWFLHTSPEICMKRMLAAGFPNIFQICHCWRDNERGNRHLPEFTMLEWYRVEADYLDLMLECEELLRHICMRIHGTAWISYAQNRIDLSSPWERISVSEAFTSYAGISLEEALARDLFDELLVERIEPRLGVNKPTFIYDYPVEYGAAAAAVKANNPSFVERFELYIGGVELANAYTELTDPIEQEDRISKDATARNNLRRKSYPTPVSFLKELSAMPPAAGIALGMDRLVMLLAGASCIDDIVAFTPEEL